MILIKNNAPAGYYIISGASGSLLWSKNDFSAQATLGGFRSTAIVDVNNDNVLELITKPENHYNTIHCYSFNNINSPTELWSYNLQENGFYFNYTNLIVGDVDSDSVLEVVLTTYRNGNGGFLILNAVNGNFEQSHFFNNSSYIHSGLIAMSQVDSDPEPEVVFYSMNYNCDMTAVVEITPTNITEKWVNVIETNGNNKLFNCNNSYTAIADLNGDGVNELLGNIFNPNNDNKWHLMIWRGSDGIVLANLSDRYFMGTGDIDNDGKSEVFAKRVSSGGRIVNRFETVEVYDFDNNNLVSKWTLPNATFPNKGKRTSVSFHISSYSYEPTLRDIDGDNINEIFIKMNNDLDLIEDVLGAYNGESNNPSLQAYYSVPEWVAINVLWSEGSIINGMNNQTLINRADGYLTILNSNLSEYSSLITGGFTSRILCKDTNNDGSMEVFVNNSRQALQDLNLSNANLYNPPTVNWQFFGLAGEEQLIIDLENDNYSEIVVSDLTDENNPTVKVLRYDKTLKWQKVFQNYTSAPSNFLAGRFNNDNVLDIFCTIYEGIQPHFVALDGRNGNTIWDATPNINGYRGIPALIDANNDNYDDIYILNQPPTTCKVISGQDGSFIHTHTSISWRPHIIIANFDSDSNYEILYTNGWTATSLFELLGSSYTWQISYPQGSHYFSFASIANITNDPDGSFDFIEGTTTGQIIAYDGDAGTEIYSKYLKDGYVYESNPGNAGSIGWFSSTDIDDDGKDEFIVPSTDGFLYAINSEEGSLLWSMDFHYPINNDVVIADVDNDFKNEILVSVSDGYVYCINQAALDAPAQVRDGPSDDIDVTYNTTQYTANWDPVLNAEGYIYSIISDNETYIIPWTNAGNSTSVTVSNLNLIYGHRYYFLVQAYNINGSSPIASSDGVYISQPLPVMNIYGYFLILSLFSIFILWKLK